MCVRARVCLRTRAAMCDMRTCTQSCPARRVYVHLCICVHCSFLDCTLEWHWEELWWLRSCLPLIVVGTYILFHYAKVAVYLVFRCLKGRSGNIIAASLRFACTHNAHTSTRMHARTHMLVRNSGLCGCCSCQVCACTCNESCLCAYSACIFALKCALVQLRVRACVRVCVRACARACVWLCVWLYVWLCVPHACCLQS